MCGVSRNGTEILEIECQVFTEDEAVPDDLAVLIAAILSWIPIESDRTSDLCVSPILKIERSASRA